MILARDTTCMSEIVFEKRPIFPNLEVDLIIIRKFSRSSQVQQGKFKFKYQPINWFVIRI
ncbi:hypothetical protein BWK47_01120 [Synechocystis sp. CACIAM 05]|nr:hypothetical protein BWK47_01120 [Synechocystis sp. CACIAM 05]